MDKFVLIVNGNPGAGKTTFAEIVSRQAETMIYSSIDHVKHIYKRYFDWDGKKTDESRKFLSDMKDFLIIETDILENDLRQKYAEFGYSKAKYLIIDIREAAEIKKYKTLFNAKTVLISSGLAPTVVTNKSDAQVHSTDYDYELDNDDSVEVFEKIIKTFLEQLKKDHAPELYFENKYGQQRFVDNITSMENAFAVIKKFLAGKGFQSYYQRYWLEEDDSIKIDVGSHTEFFVIKNLKGVFK